MTTSKMCLSLLFIIILFSCGTNDSFIAEMEEEVETSVYPNILLIIADDMGLDATPGYNIGTIKPNMPTLQSMINTGITFSNVWSSPLCTPTKAGILTGKYGFRTGVLKVGDVMPTSEISIQKHLDNNSSTYTHAVIGK